MANEPVKFPQHRTRPPALTPAEIIRDGGTLERIMARLAVVSPHMKAAEVAALIKADMARLEREVADLDALEGLVAPVLEGGDKKTVGEALEVLAGRGNEMALALIEHENRPESREFLRFMDLAVEADPYWQRVGDGWYRRLKGAVHETPEALVEGYKRSRGLACEARVLSILARLPE